MPTEARSDSPDVDGSAPAEVDPVESEAPISGVLDERKIRASNRGRDLLGTLKDRLPRARATRPLLDEDNEGWAFISLKLNGRDFDGFAPDAAIQFTAVVDNFTAQLGSVAIDLAKGRNGTMVDVGEVMAADDDIRGPQEALLKGWYVGLAGFMGGISAAIATALSFATEDVAHEFYWQVGAACTGTIAGVLFYMGRPRKARHARL